MFVKHNSKSRAAMVFLGGTSAMKFTLVPYACPSATKYSVNVCLIRLHKSTQQALGVVWIQSILEVVEEYHDLEK
jgi:hypothetical protein